MWGEYVVKDQLSNVVKIRVHILEVVIVVTLALDVSRVILLLDQVNVISMMTVVPVIEVVD